MVVGKGYLKFVKSKGHVYVYLHGRLEGDASKKHLYAFGSTDVALEKMYTMRNEFLKELSELGFGYDDLEEWILTLETRSTRRGKLIKILAEQGGIS